MALPASPPITMAQVRAEFGGTVGVTKLSAYVRGGSFVPNIAANSGVPTSVPIRLNQLCGATSYYAVAAPASAYGSRSGTAGTATTGSVTVTVTGSGGTVTRSWTRVSGDAAISISSTTAGTVTWSASMSAVNNYRTATWKCTVTDTVKGVTVTNNVVVELEYFL